MGVHLFGGSDDLVEVRGDVDEEWNVYATADDTARITVTTADDEVIELAAWYGDLPNSDDGGWCIRVTANAEPVAAAHIAARGEGEADDADGCPGYSEKVSIDAEVASVRVRWHDVDRTERP